MKKTTLVIMAAGLGSRYGGDKQTEGIGPNHEMLMEYAIFDAVRAGFSKVVFVIKPDMKPLMDTLCGELVASSKTSTGEKLSVCYAIQDFASLPSFYALPEGRRKPYGTVHAVLCAREYVHEPFAIINADDYYGVDAYASMHDCLQTLRDGEAAMVGYYLKNTVSDYGTVTRGVCTHKDGWLEKVTETFKIRPFADGTIRDTAQSEEGVVLEPQSLVSMNFWGCTPAMFADMRAYFEDFLRNLPQGSLGSECLLPVMADDMLRNGTLKVRVLSTNAVWFGITYPQDKPVAQAELARLHAQGVYPQALCGA